MQGGEGAPPAYRAVEAAPLSRQLKDVLEDERSEDGWIIAMVELLAFVVLAAAQGESWRGDLVYYVTDNTNAKAWLAKRRPKHPLARHLIRLVQRLEAKYEFTVTGVYIRTYNNDVAGWLTRQELPEVHEELARRARGRLEPPEKRGGALLAEARERLLKLPGEEGPAAEAA